MKSGTGVVVGGVIGLALIVVMIASFKGEHEEAPVKKK